jgi:capsular exopolysaccharide synthesis family protein
MEENEIESQIDLKTEILKYLSFWKIFLVFVVIALVSANIYLRYQSAIYVVESKIKILEENNKGLKLPSELLGLMTSKSGINLENEIEVFKSKKLFGRVVSELNLTTRYYTEGKFKRSEQWNVPFKITSIINKDSMFGTIAFGIQEKKGGYELISKNGNRKFVKGSHVKTRIDNLDILIEPNPNGDRKLFQNKLLIQITPYKHALQTLINKISVEKVGKESDILTVKIQDPNVPKSIDVINKLVEIFNEDGINDKQLVNKKTVDFIDDRFQFLIQELDSIENEKKEFKKSKNMSFIEADAGIDITKKATTDQSLFQIETQIELSNLLKEALNSKNSTVLPGNIGLDNAIINQLIGEYNTLLLQRNRLLKTAGTENPTLMGLESQIAEVKNNINQSILTYNKQLKISLSQQELNYSKSKGLVSEIPSNEKILRAIERQQKIKENLYLLLLQKREEAAIAYAVTSPTIKIVDYANASLSPIAPKKNIFYLVSFALAIMIPFGGIYIYFLLDNKIKTKNEKGFVNSQIPIIAEIPYFKHFKLFEDKNDRSVHAESFRILSTNVNFSLPIKENNLGQTILVTSSIMGEGKTFICTNLALALASYDKKVLLIGADMRKPRLHSSLNMEKVDCGLSTYLHDSKINWKDVIVSNNKYNENLDIIFSGYIPPNPSNIISNGRFETMIKEAKLEYDYIIIDTAPTIYVNDTFIISNLADLTVYLTRFDFTDKELLNYAAGLKTSGKLKNMVFILNGIGENKNYNYKYSYNYGYEYGYDENNKETNNKLTFKNNSLFSFFKKFRKNNIS